MPTDMTSSMSEEVNTNKHSASGVTGGHHVLTPVVQLWRYVAAITCNDRNYLCERVVVMMSKGNIHTPITAFLEPLVL